MLLPRVLIVDDEPGIRLVLEHTLRSEGYSLESAGNGAEALARLTQADPPYDLLLIDLQMEPIGGMQVLQAAHEYDPDIPVIILTAHGTMDSAVRALRLSAFDYLFKPATPATIRQRVRAGVEERQRALHRRRLLAQIDALRQTLVELNPSDDPPPRPAYLDNRFVHSGELTIDRHRRLATLADTPLPLTSTEFDILFYLVEAAPEPLSAGKLVELALGYDCLATEAREIVKWHIHQLRRKIEPESTQPQYIKTIRHRGYLWSGE